MSRYKELEVGSRKLLVYLPPSYEHSEEHYPVVYVQDGGFLFTESINYMEHLFRTGRLREIIMVGVVTEVRNDEYTPWPALPLAEGFDGFGGRGRAYIEETAEVIKPYIDNEYRTYSDAGNTAVIGGSLGGLISFFAGYWRPDVFGKLGLLSSSFWYDGVLEFIRQGEGLHKDLKIYLSVGECEGIYKNNAQRHMVPNNKEVRNLILDKGLPAEQMMFHLEPDGTHDDVFMIKAFAEALQFLFQPQKGYVVMKMNTDRYQIPQTVSWRMHSRQTGREYRIFVAAPAGPPPEGGYPVLYSLDANASFGMLAESMRLQSRGPHGIPAAVIVGIGYDSNEPLVTNERFYDYTVYADEQELPARPIPGSWPLTGGAEDFLDFVENQVKEAVGQYCPVNRSKEAVFGHSLGGFLVLYALMTRPECYRRYIAASPSIWWKNHLLYELWESSRGTFGKVQSERELLMAVGTEEKPSMIKDSVDFTQKVKADQQRRLSADLLQIEGEGHVSILPALISPMLRFVTR